MARQCRVVVGLVLVIAACGSAAAEPVQWSGNGHFYEVVYVGDGLTWDQADQSATAAGRHLATITSAAENNFVFSLVDDPQFWTLTGWKAKGPWLGGYQFPDTGGPADQWQWVTGEPWTYTNWAPGQPNDYGLYGEDKMHFFSATEARASTWNDTRGIDTDAGAVAYVAEWVPEPSSVVLLVMASLGLGVGWWRRRRAA